MGGVKVRAITEDDKTIEWEICVEDGSIYILHNNAESNWSIPKNMRWYGFWWFLNYVTEDDYSITGNITSLEIIEQWEEPTNQTKEYKEWDIYPWWESLTPLPRWKTMKQLWYKEWDLFVNVLDVGIRKWQVVKLENDDESTFPWFNTQSCICIGRLAPLPKDTPHQTPEKENTKHTYELQYVRSDGVIFTKDTIWGKKIEDLNREKIEALTRVREINALLQAHKAKF